MPVNTESPAHQAKVTVLFVGASAINFGSGEGKWNHSDRIELKLGDRLQVLGIVDPDAMRANTVLKAKSTSPAARAYANAAVYSSLPDATAGLAASPPDIVILGTPPAFRGTRNPSCGLNSEEQITTAFPATSLFVEKPLSTGPVSGVLDVAQLLEARKSNLVSVGYMLRYSAAAQKMKQIIDDNGLVVMATSARYIMSYEFATKMSWWYKSMDAGPIVEQATHLCDLSRYFGGDVDLESIFAHSVEWYEKPGKLAHLNVDESAVPEDDRIPRFTSATWKYDSGAIGSLEHGVVLTGTEFATELVVFCDGYQLKLDDPYNRPTLYVRRPGVAAEEVYAFHDDDAFYNEFDTFIDHATGGSMSSGSLPILSSYADACKTYEMTWQIRWASEKTRRPKPAKPSQ